MFIVKFATWRPHIPTVRDSRKKIFERKQITGAQPSHIKEEEEDGMKVKNIWSTIKQRIVTKLIRARINQGIRDEKVWAIKEKESEQQNPRS